MAKCGLPTECFTRVTGYYRPVKSFNSGKKQEFKDRKTFDVQYALNKSLEYKNKQKKAV